MFDFCILGGRHAVVLICAECGDQIHDGCMAAVVYPRPCEDGGSAPVSPRIVHKGECQFRTEQEFEKLYGRPLWMELKYFIERGLAAIGIAVETLNSAEDVDDSRPDSAVAADNA